MAKKEKLSKDKRSIVIKRLLTYIRPYRKFLLLSILSALSATLCALVFPLITGEAIDSIADGNWSSFFIYLVALLSITAISGLFQYILNQSNNRLTYLSVRDMRKDLFNNIQYLELSYLDSHSSGSIVSRMIADIDQVADGLLMGFTQFFTGVLSIFGTLVCLFYINWIVALVVVIVTPISLFTASFIAKRTYNLFHKQSKARGEQTAFIDEMITGAQVVSSFSMEEKSQIQFDALNDELSNSSLYATFYSSLTNPVTRFVNSVVYTGVALSGGLAAISGHLSIGALSATLAYAKEYTKPFNEISSVMTELQNALASADRVFELMDERKEPRDNNGAVSLSNPSGSIDIDHVFFSYDKKKPLITDLSLSVKPGMKVAIVGPTGSGKTTIINLLMRFYDVDSGFISVDGVDIQNIKRADLRDCYGMVLQETWLKSGTIRDNLLIGARNASDRDIDAVVKSCHLEQFIATLPNGYDEVLSEEHGAISEGQKQLLCIARAMLSDPKMLILDEATSSIDTRTELIIQDAFENMMKGRTSFIVAHRLSTIKSADLILVLDKGNVVEKGRHDELLKAKGFYYNLYNSQFSNQGLC